MRTYFTICLFTIFFKPCDAQHLNFQDSTRFQTAHGENYKYQWNGTNQGLEMINKRNQKINFLTKDNSELPDNYVTGIACMLNGHTYTSTKNGILLWDNYTFLLMNKENTRLPENHIIGLSVGPGDCLLIHTKNCGILKAIGRCIRIYKIEKPKKSKSYLRPSGRFTKGSTSTYASKSLFPV